MILAGACSKGGRGQILRPCKKSPPPPPPISYHSFFLHYFVYVFVEILFTKIENICLYRCF